MIKFCRWISGVALASLLLLALPAFAAQPESPGATGDNGSLYRSLGLAAAAAFTITVCILGASYAVARIGSAALGASSEKPELLTRSLVFVALAEGLGVLGFAIAVMLLQKI